MMMTIHKNGQQICHVGPVPSGWHFVVSKWNLKAHFTIDPSKGQPPAPNPTKKTSMAVERGSTATFKVGERIRIKNLAEELAEDHGGWTSSMASSLGKQGTIEEIISTTRSRCGRTVATPHGCGTCSRSKD